MLVNPCSPKTDTQASSKILLILLFESQDTGSRRVPCPHRLRGYDNEIRIYSGQVEAW